MLQRVAERAVGDEDLGANLLESSEQRGNGDDGDLDRAAEQHEERNLWGIADRLRRAAEDREGHQADHAGDASSNTRDADVAKREGDQCRHREVQGQRIGDQHGQRGAPGDEQRREPHRPDANAEGAGRIDEDREHRANRDRQRDRRIGVRSGQGQRGHDAAAERTDPQDAGPVDQLRGP